MILAITGASGVIYGVRLLEELIKHRCKIFLIITEHGKLLLRHELNKDWRELTKKVEYYFDEHDMSAPIASGSFNVDAMVIAPCSLKTLAAIAHGLALNLVARAAECILKERRKLILLIRETPLSSISLWNMLKISLAGGLIMPAAPAFYHKPKDIDNLVNYIVGKILSQLGLEHELFPPWTGYA